MTGSGCGDLLHRRATEGETQRESDSTARRLALGALGYRAYMDCRPAMMALITSDCG